MTNRENQSQVIGLTNLDVATPQSTNLLSREASWSRLENGPDVRTRFVESNLGKHLAYQIRSMRDGKQWTQQELAEKVDMNQNAISRLENPFYGKPTLTTLKRLASAFDVGLVVRFVPFSQLVDWVSGTPYLDKGLSGESLAVPSFNEDELSSEASVAEPFVRNLQEVTASTYGYLTVGAGALETLSSPITSVIQGGRHFAFLSTAYSPEPRVENAPTIPLELINLPPSPIHGGINA